MFVFLLSVVARVEGNATRGLRLDYNKYFPVFRYATYRLRHCVRMIKCIYKNVKEVKIDYENNVARAKKSN